MILPFDFHLLRPTKAEKGLRVCRSPQSEFGGNRNISKREYCNRKEVIYVSKTNDEDFVVIGYTLEQAIADGVLIEVFKKGWKKLSGGKPIVATAHIHGETSLAGLMEIWNEYVYWRQNVMPTLAEEDQLFHTGMNGKTVWVMEDGQAFTILYPKDY